MSMNIMVRGIKVKTHRMGTKPELELTLLTFCQSSASGLTNRPDHFMLESGWIFNDLVDMFVASLMGIGLVFSIMQKTTYSYLFFGLINSSDTVSRQHLHS